MGRSLFYQSPWLVLDWQEVCCCLLLHSASVSAENRCWIFLGRKPEEKWNDTASSAVWKDSEKAGRCDPLHCIVMRSRDSAFLIKPISIEEARTCQRACPPSLNAAKDDVGPRIFCGWSYRHRPSLWSPVAARYSDSGDNCCCAREERRSFSTPPDDEMIFLSALAGLFTATRKRRALLLLQMEFIRNTIWEWFLLLVCGVFQVQALQNVSCWFFQEPSLDEYCWMRSKRIRNSCCNLWQESPWRNSSFIAHSTKEWRKWFDRVDPLDRTSPWD